MLLKLDPNSERNSSTRLILCLISINAYLCNVMKKLIALLIRNVPRKYLQRISGPGLKLLGLFLIGSNVTCPVCLKSFRKFLPYGRVNPRPNALCPNCLSLERHRLIWLYLKENTDFFNRRLHRLRFNNIYSFCCHLRYSCSCCFPLSSGWL